MIRVVSEKYKSIEKFALDYLSLAGFVPEIEKEYIIFPGFCDVHVHFREPGFCYKETVETGSAAAAHGGYTAVCPMPNLKPAPDCLDNLKIELDAAEKSPVRVIPYGTITRNEEGAALSDMDEMSPFVCGFSDDGRGVQAGEMMESAMLKAKALGKIIAAHCEDNSLLNGGYIHEGRYAAAHGHKGISSASEYKQIERDIVLCEKTGCAYHVCHISTKESVALIRDAKARGVNITCETGPHYLALCEDDLIEDGRFKMNPPLRSAEDKAALIEGIKDGTIDMIATDHAPHSAEEKSKGLAGSLMGIVGLETAFPVLWTKLVKTGIISEEKLADLLCDNPKKRFSIDTGDDFTVFEVSTPYRIDSEKFLSKGRATPFDGDEVYGRCVLTVCRGKTVYSEI
ncbi:MAG: dihydroorotase [Clostridia bacterium]|nr:dihydroorotase [Clostridia bacterium]